MKYFFENHENILKIGVAYTKKLFEKKSPFQKVQVLKTKGYGNMLINDDIIMTCDRDEFVYHEMMAHVPLFTHQNAKKVLIIGGGDGGTAREVLKHKKIQKCVMVEIDSTVIQACKKHLPKLNAFKDSKLELKIEDGAKFIEDKENAFDAILVDSSDPIGPSSVLFGKSFYKNVYKALKSDGILTAQAGSSFYNLKQQKQSLKMCQDLGFKNRALYYYNNLSYPPGAWAFLFASKSQRSYFKPERIKNSKILFKYYNSEIHQSCFARPEFVKNSFGPLWSL